MEKKAIMLLSGGVDSAVTLYMAARTHKCHALVLDYGQKARKEIDCAKKIAAEAGVDYEVLKISFPWKGSALLDDAREIPVSAGDEGIIPDTYVPSRNIIFLSFAVSFAEAAGAEAVFIGAHQLDYSNYPDCRSEFFDTYRELVKRGTKAGVEGHAINIETPVLDMTKKEIVALGSRLGVPFEDTWSCYDGGEEPCGKCESCRFRIEAFKEAGVEDPVH